MSPLRFTSVEGYDESFTRHVQVKGTMSPLHVTLVMLLVIDRVCYTCYRNLCLLDVYATRGTDACWSCMLHVLQMLVQMLVLIVYATRVTDAC